MSRPVLLLIASIAAGIVAADVVFYEASVAVPPWLGASLWGFAVVMALAALAVHRWQRGRSIFVGRPLFVGLVALFFGVVGFARYAAWAEEMQAAWKAMERPPVNRGNPDEFDYRRWCWVQGRADRANMRGTQTAGRGGEKTRLKEGQEGEKRRLKEGQEGERFTAKRVREKLLGSLREAGLEDEELAVVAAMTLGERSGLDDEMRELYAAAGASHLLALSGLHLGILVGVFIVLLSGRLLYSRWRWPLAVMVVVFTWGYASLTGFPSSLVRASLMTSLLVLLSCVQRRNQGMNALLVTVLVMLLVRPVFLFDVGAQLSCLSMAGIIMIYRPLTKWAYEGSRRYHLFWLSRYHLLWPLRLLAVSVCAQMLTWPLVCYHFHQYPLYGALFSIVLVPLTTLLVYGSMAMMAVGLVWTTAAAWLAKGIGWLVALQLWTMRVETSLPGAVMPDFWSRKAEPQLVVYHNRACPALHLIASPSQSWLLMPEPERADSGMRYIAKSFWRRRLTKEPVVLRGRKAVAAKGMRAVMLDGEKADGNGKTAAHRMSRKEGDTQTKEAREMEVLWITRGFRGGSLKEVAGAYRPKLVVLDASLARWQRRELAVDAMKRGWKVYDVAEKGALKLKQQYSDEGAEK